MAPRSPDLGDSLLPGRLLPPSAGWVLASPSRMESLMECLNQVYLYTSQSGTKSEKVCGDSSRLAREAGGAGPRSQACWLCFRAEAAHTGNMVCTLKRKGTAHRLTAPLQLATTAAECAGSAIWSQVAGGPGGSSGVRRMEAEPSLAHRVAPLWSNMPSAHPICCAARPCWLPSLCSLAGRVPCRRGGRQCPLHQPF